MTKQKNTIILFVFVFFSTVASAQLFHRQIRDQSVDFRNGNLPYRKNNAWGFVNKHNEIVIAPQYDTLFYAGTGWCIAKKATGYFLIDENFHSFFDQPVSDISYKGNYFAIDSAKIKSWYKILPDNSLKHFKDEQSMLSYFVRTKNYHYKVQSPLIDSLVYVRKEPRDSAYLACYYKDGSILKFPEFGCEPIFEKPYYLKYSVAALDQDPKWENKWNCIPAGIVNLEKKDTIFTESELKRTFNHKGENFLIVKGKDQKESVLNEKGDILFSSSEAIEYKNGGFLAEGFRPSKKHRLFQKAYTHYTCGLYSFPDMKLIGKNMHYPEYSGYILSTGSGRERLYYADGILFHKSKHRESFGDISPNPYFGIPKLFVIETKTAVSLISSTGKTLYKAKNKDVSIEINDYNKGSNNFTVAILDKNRHVDQLAIYITSEEKLEFLDYERLEFIDDNHLIACSENKEYGKDCSIINIHGESVNNHVFKDLIYMENGAFKAFIERNDQDNRIYDRHLNLVLEGYDLEPLHVQDYIDTSFFVYEHYSTGSVLKGVMDQDFKVVIPNKYKEIYYNGYTRHFVVIDEKNQVGYVRLDGTELFKP